MWSGPDHNIDLGSNEPGMTLQYRERGQIIWLGYTVDSEAVMSPVDIDALPFGVYRLV